MAINTLYLDKGVLKNTSSIYSQSNPKNIRLDDFFQYSVLGLLQKKLDDADWKEKFDPEKYLYSVCELKEIDTFLKGDYFRNLAQGVLGVKKLKISKIRYEIRRFVPGNYTLLHDAEKEKPGIDFIIDFSQSKESFGGHTTYLTESEELLISSPMPNSISFIERKNKLMKFTKYVQHRQKNPIVQVVGTILKL